MLGRAAYHDPMMLTLVDERVFGDAAVARSTLRDVIAAMADYAEGELARGRAAQPDHAAHARARQRRVPARGRSGRSSVSMRAGAGQGRR